MLEFHYGSSLLSIDDGAHSPWMLPFSCRLYLYPFYSFETDLLSYFRLALNSLYSQSSTWFCDLCTSAPAVAGVTGLSLCPALTLGFEMLWPFQHGKTTLVQNSKKMAWNWTWKMAEKCLTRYLKVVQIQLPRPGNCSYCLSWSICCYWNSSSPNRDRKGC